MILWFSISLLALIVLGVLIWWLFIETEGVYLGRGVVIWLYDVYATRYNQIKDYTPHYENLLLADPIMRAVYPNNAPMILDIATGTARLPIAMMGHSLFEGHIIGIDLSRKMLQQAAYDLADNLAYVDLLHAPAEYLPFADDTFDVVTCLEALEFLESPEKALQEATRVLRPGGILLTTLRINIKTMPNKIWSKEKMESYLKTLGYEKIIFERWQDQYTQVWARKSGHRHHNPNQPPLETFLQCPTCHQTGFTFDSPQFHCSHCNAQISIGEDGVIELFAVQDC